MQWDDLLIGFCFGFTLGSILTAYLAILINRKRVTRFQAIEKFIKIAQEKGYDQ